MASGRKPTTKVKSVHFSSGIRSGISPASQRNWTSRPTSSGILPSSGFLSLASGERLFVNIHPQELSEGWLMRPDDPLFGHDAEIFLEITESVPMSHTELCMSVLKELASRVAVHVVVDDLGAGYSNLLRIADLEPSVVKLDRQLVTGIQHRARQRHLVGGIVDLCGRLGAEVVAEGVETVDEYLALLETGVHYGQGWLFARAALPIPAVTWPPFGSGDA